MSKIVLTLHQFPEGPRAGNYYFFLIMSKVKDYAVYITTARKATYTSMTGFERLNVVKSFYNSKGLSLPASLTTTTSKLGARLTQPEKIKIQGEYISALQAGNVSEELEARLKAVNNPNAVCTFTSCLSYSEALKEWGVDIVAARLIDALSVADNEEFHKNRKFEVPASVAVSEIPAFIKELQAIYDAAAETAETAETETE